MGNSKTISPQSANRVSAISMWSVRVLGRKLMSCSQCQELGHRAHLASDWSFVFMQSIRRQVSSLTQLLTLTTTHKFPSLIHGSFDVLNVDRGSDRF